MKPLSSSARQGMIRAVYLSPAIVGTLLLIYSFIPHLFFVYGDAAYNTLSPFELMGNTWTECQALFDAAEKFGADFVATGHYARIDRTKTGETAVFCGVGRNDQSYMLCRMPRECFSKLIFPLGGFSKDEVT